MARTVSRTRRPERDTEDQPTRGRSRNHDDDGGGRRRRPTRDPRSAVDDEEEPTFNTDDDDDTDEQPRRRRATKVKDEPRKSSRKAKGGWGSVAEVKRSTGGDFANDFKAEEGVEYLLKFGDEEPFDVYAQHWIERKGKRSFTCGEETYGECPLCEVGDKPSAQIAFNVIVLDIEDDGDPTLYRWTVGSQVADTMMEFAKDEKTKPINGINTYFSVKRTKKDKRWNTKIQNVKARDLDEDFGVDPLTQDEIDDLLQDAYDYTSTEDTPLSVLNEIADELV